MTVVAWILLGIIVGIIGHLLDKREARGGLLGAIFFGIAGSVTGGFLATLLFGSTGVGLDLSTFLIVFSGSMFLLMIQRTLFTGEERF